MTLIAGASRYVNQVAAAQFGGSAAAAPTFLGTGSTQSLLDIGRGISAGRFGLSNNARAINSQFLEQSNSLGNRMLSLAAGSDATIYGAQQEILAMRSRLSDYQLAPSLRGNAVDTEA